MILDFKKIKKSIKSKSFKFYLVVLVTLFILNYITFQKAFNFFFWIDDWQFLWAGVHGQTKFTDSALMGTYWQVKTGLFHYYYAQLYTVWPSSEIWQQIGFLLRFINSIIFFFFAQELIKQKKLAFMGAILFSVYSGGIQAYTWHRTTALAVGFVMLGSIFYNKFLNDKNLKNILFSIIFFVLSLASYVGRAIGFLPMIFLWSFLVSVKNMNLKSNSKYLVFIFLLIGLTIFMLVKNAPNTLPTTMVYFSDSLKNIHIFFGSIGNLIRIPLFKYTEVGSLYFPDKLSISLGIALFVLWTVFTIYYLVKKTKSAFLLTISLAWIFFFYLTNWLYGGGGTSTAVGSTHRYLSVSAVGVVLALTTLVGLIKKESTQYIVIFVLAILFLNYSNFVLTTEESVRGKQVVEHVYQQIIDKTKGDNEVQVLIIDTPNKLKSTVVLGWMPYAFGYYRAIPSVTKFPMVFPDQGSGINWLCGTEEEKLQVTQTMGVIDYRHDKNVSSEHIYSWKLNVNGDLTDTSDAIRQIYNECKQKNEK